MSSTNETRYRNFFIDILGANVWEYDREFRRVIKENGYSEDIKKEFYLAAFNSVITAKKKNLPKNQDYKKTICHYYNSFIKLLKEDNINHSKCEKDLSNFQTKEFPKMNYVPEYKEYNPNTKYGRSKALEQARRNYANGTPEYQNDSNKIKLVLWLIVIIVAVIFFFVKAKLSA